MRFCPGISHLTISQLLAWSLHAPTAEPGQIPLKHVGDAPWNLTSHNLTSGPSAADCEIVRREIPKKNLTNASRPGALTPPLPETPPRAGGRL